MNFYCNGKMVGLELDKLSDEDFLILEKEFKAAKERRGSSYVPKTYNLGTIPTLHEFVSRVTHRGRDTNLHSVEYKKLEQALLRICDLVIGNYEIKKFGDVERIVVKTNLPRTVAKRYAIMFNGLVGTLDILVPKETAIIEDDK